MNRLFNFDSFVSLIWRFVVGVLLLILIRCLVVFFVLLEVLEFEEGDFVKDGVGLLYKKKYIYVL